MRTLILSAAILALAPAAFAETITGTSGSEIEITELESFDGPWAMTILPDGRLSLIHI